MSDFEKDEIEIEQLFKDIDLEQDELGFGNHDNAPFPESQVQTRTRPNRDLHGRGQIDS